MAQLPLLLFPFVGSPLPPLCILFYLLGTLQLCQDRPPQSQVACKLTPFAPPFTQPTPPLQIPRIPTAQRLTKTTSGIFRLLLSGTCIFKRFWSRTSCTMNFFTSTVQPGLDPWFSDSSDEAISIRLRTHWDIKIHYVWPTVGNLRVCTVYFV